MHLKSPVSALIATALSTLFTMNVAMSAEMAPVTVPIKIVGTSPIITVRIDGLDVPVHFDIGRSGAVSLFPSVLDEIDKVPIGVSVGGLSMEGPTGKEPIYEVGLVQVGEANFVHVTIGEDFHDTAFQADFVERTGAHGFAGTGLFEGHKLVIDYQRRELTIIAPDVPPARQSACSGIEVPLITGLDWGLVSKARTEIGDILFVWDTGAPANIILKRRTDAENVDVSDNDTVTLNQFVLGEHEFGPFDGVIGYDFFADNIVCVDFPGDRLLIRQ